MALFANARGVALALSLIALEAGAEGAKRSVAVLPYLTLGVSTDDAQRITKLVAREYASRSGEKTLTSDQLSGKLPDAIPDGCPMREECVAGLTKKLGVDRLLFASYITGEGDQIEVSLSYVGGGDNRPAKFAMSPDAEDWKPAVQAGVLPLVLDEGKPPAVTDPLYKKPWFWAAAGGGAVAAGAVTFFLLRPSLGFVR